MEKLFFLVGARGAGKTTLGTSLARRLGCEFFDTDRYMQERDCLTVSEVVEREGWEGFRRREKAALREVLGPERVVATGGGMVLDPGNRALMRECGVVLYLAAPAAVLASRLARDGNQASRPSLTGKSTLEEVAEVLAARDSLYRETAHHVLDAGRDFDGILAEALEICGRSSGGTKSAEHTSGKGENPVFPS